MTIKALTEKEAEIIELIRDAGAEDLESIKNTLEDGEALAALGITDQEGVEDAHSYVCLLIDVFKDAPFKDLLVNMIDSRFISNGLRIDRGMPLPKPGTPEWLLNGRYKLDESGPSYKLDGSGPITGESSGGASHLMLKALLGPFYSHDHPMGTSLARYYPVDGLLSDCIVPSTVGPLSPEWVHEQIVLMAKRSESEE